MDINTSFSLEVLRLARIDAKAYGVKIPKGLTALPCGGGQWFVQGHGDPGIYVSAGNGYEARAKYIEAKINEAHPQLEQSA